ncbi:MAG: YolD-like family protein [Clostridia bacterium]|nr:YolD-like family protein [Clostridia bacterium]
MSGPYDDIFGMPRPEPTGRARMPIRDRAAQFAPFAALTGFGEMIRESERQTESRPVLTEELAAALNESLQHLQETIDEHPRVSVSLFMPDTVKDGGSLLQTEGEACHIDAAARILKLQDGREMIFDDIYAIRILNASEDT